MIAVIDYDAGNIGSVSNVLARLGAKFEVTSDASRIRMADGVIFPGQGRAGPALKSLKKTGLDKLLPSLRQPFLGICLGMQLMVDELDEDNQSGLGIIPGSCELFKDVSPIPHMGWNQVFKSKDTSLLKGLPNSFYQYFVHSYAVKTSDEFIIASTDYGDKFASVIQKGNFFGVQFHPEKSADDGERILKNFLQICKAAK